MEYSQKSLLDISCHLLEYQYLKGFTYFVAISWVESFAMQRHSLRLKTNWNLRILIQIT